MCPTIPSTGRLGSLAKIIVKETNEEVFNELFQDYSNSLKGEKQAEWVLKMIKLLEQKVGIESARKILEQNGRQSCGKGFRNTVTRIMQKSNSIKDFVNELSEHYKRSSFFEFVDDNIIIGGHRNCYTMIKSAPKPIDSKIFCHYCVGHGKQFYEAAIGAPVEVEIIETVMTGGQTCKFRFKF